MTTPKALLDEQAERMAHFCVATGQPPSVYWNLTQREINAFIDAVNAQNRG